jgi:nitrate/TMAO reductase-like tetraheme cytochrome c subunit
MRTMLRVLMAAIAVTAWTSPASAQQSRCADCHFATPNAPNPRHLADWDRSPHARNDVGCEKCHGGNPDTFERFLAHAPIIRRGNPECRTDVQNLPDTCGRCHLGERLAFQKSHHAAMLKGGDLRAPSCATCHGEVAAYLPSPKQLESECRECHGPKAAQPRPEYVSNARRMLEDIADVRASLDAAKTLIKRIKNKTDRARFDEQYRNAEVPIIETVREAHAFVFDRARERLGVARQRAAALLESLANPRSTSTASSTRQEP